MQMARVRFPDDACVFKIHGKSQSRGCCATNHMSRRQCSLVVERLLRKQKVAGSIPVVGFFHFFLQMKKLFSREKILRPRIELGTSRV